ncbi:hypothetical protein JCM19240_6451 [Vibrio maritimus]|uniref:DUF2956 domain-containing protein n=1 Tax=Vibrio maritimus TaxID=990268 RepID=A0A090T2T9_9VIBR|nr:hypothetical protein JCM19240_6451 [Vibrio maritimus]
MKTNKNTPSVETQQEAMKIAKATQKPGQTKEQTKLVAQGIEKGIALYKKQQKEKKRQADKAQKKQKRAKSVEPASNQAITDTSETKSAPRTAILPWALLAISWVGFIAYVAL